MTAFEEHRGVALAPGSTVTPASSTAGGRRRSRAATHRRRRLSLLVVLTSFVAGTLGGAFGGWLVSGEQAATTTAQGAAAGGADPGAGLPALVQRVTVSVVALDVTRRETDPMGGSTTQISSGTGFVLTAGGVIVTNAHVVKGAQQIRVTFSDGRRAGAAVLGRDVAEDLAVLRVGRTGLVPLTLAADHTVQVGEFVVATGNALALEGSPTVTVGIISALNRSITLNDGSRLTHLLQTDAAISPGDSGGPLLTASGAVIGINSAAASGSTAQNIGFAIPISRARSILLHLAGLS